MKTSNLSTLNIIDIINKKKTSQKLTKDEIEYFVQAAIDSKINQTQISALLQLIYLNGMQHDEIVNLTLAMRNHSELININTQKPIVDKHSTGGIGDKVSIILCPILASLGVLSPKLSGKGLGITGGTIDKLNAVGCKTDLTKKEYTSLARKYGFFIAQQTEDIVPADRIFYAIRNDIAAVDSMPLIVSSIMSKKLITNAEYIYLDVKVGSGAFFKTVEEAEYFAKECINIGKKDNRKVICYLTNMDEPLGATIGNHIEVYEAINFLLGNYFNKKLRDYIFELVTNILLDLKIASSKEIARLKIEDVISNEKAFKLLRSYASECEAKINKEDYQKPYKAKFKHEIFATKSGYINYKSNYTFGRVSLLLKAGRISKEDKIDNESGILFNKFNNDKVTKGDLVLTIYSSSKIKDEVISELIKNIEYLQQPNEEKPKIIKIIK